MASKKQSATPTVAEKPAKTVKTAVAAVAAKAEKVAEIVVKKVTAKTAAPAVSAPKVEKVAEPVAKKATAKVVAPAPKTAKITLALPKEAVENAETVAVLGDFNHWQDGIVLAKQKDGSFKASVELEKGRSYQYRFLINGEKWENDWSAEAYAPTPFGTYNSVVTA